MRVLALMCFMRRLWAPVLVLVLMLVGCGDDDTVKPPGGTNDSLVFTREDASVVAFPAGTEASSGFIVFHRLPCPGGTTVDFSIDAVIGSEFWDMPPVTVRGRFTARVTGPLPAGAQAPRLGGLQ